MCYLAGHTVPSTYQHWMSSLLCRCCVLLHAINTECPRCCTGTGSGPSWQAVTQVHRDAYGVAGTLVAVAIFLSGATGSLDKVGTTMHDTRLHTGLHAVSCGSSSAAAYSICICCCCCSHINSHNQVRGHRTGSSHSGAEEYPREIPQTSQRWYMHISQLTQFIPPPETYKK